MSTPLIDRESTSRPTSSDVRQSSSFDASRNVRSMPSAAKTTQPKASAGRSSAANFNFEMPQAVDRNGRPISDEAVANRRRFRAWAGSAMMAAVVFSSVTFITAGASTLVARVRLESARTEGISAISRNRAALASIDRRNRVGGTTNGYLAGGELEQWATTVGFTDAPQGSATALASRVPSAEKPRAKSTLVASLVTSGPYVKVIRVDAR